MNVNQLVHPTGPKGYQRVSLPSISDIFVDLPSANTVYPPQEQKNYSLRNTNSLPPLSSPRVNGPLSPSGAAPSYIASLPPITTGAAGPVSAQPIYQYTHYNKVTNSNSSSSNSTSPSPKMMSNEHVQNLNSASSSSIPKRKTRNNLPRETTYTLLKWLNEHLNHPYPNSFEKNQLMHSTGLNQQQLSNWFINARRRKIKVLKQRECL